MLLPWHGLWHPDSNATPLKIGILIQVGKAALGDASRAERWRKGSRLEEGTGARDLPEGGAGGPR